MTSAREAAGSPPLHPPGGGRRRSALDQLPPPANSNKPLTPFGIEDILGRPRGGSPPGPAAPPARLPEKAAGPRGGGCAPSSPLCALEELASKTFQGLELGVLQAAEGTGAAGAPRPGGQGRASGRCPGRRAGGSGTAPPPGPWRCRAVPAAPSPARPR